MSKTASSSVPAPSELIMQPPQHTTQLMQTQQTDTRVDTLQEQMPPEELFSEFKAKKRDKPITLVKQDGANCGCFAAGMAIASLIRIREVEKQTDQAWYQEYAFPAVQLKVKQFGQDLAKSIESIAQQQFLSSVGEMFDADSLVEATNMVLQDTSVLPRTKVGKYKAKAAQFHTPEQLAELLTRATAMGVRVLIPYYSQNEAPARTPDGNPVPAEQMSNAHWGVVSCKKIPSVASSALRLEANSPVYLHEGHETAIRQRCTIEDVARSNLCLGDIMNWNPYITSCFAQDAYEQHEDVFSQIIINLIQSAIPDYSDEKKEDIYFSFLNKLLSGDNAFRPDTIQSLVQQHFGTDAHTTETFVPSIYNFFNNMRNLIRQMTKSKIQSSACRQGKQVIPKYLPLLKYRRGWKPFHIILTKIFWRTQIYVVVLS